MQSRPARDKADDPAGSTVGEAAEDKGGKSPQGKEPASAFAMHEHIGARLKAMFARLVEEPVPDKFRELLEELERKQPTR